MAKKSCEKSGTFMTELFYGLIYIPLTNYGILLQLCSIHRQAYNNDDNMQLLSAREDEEILINISII